MLDPACGSGTFLILAIRPIKEHCELLDLDKLDLALQKFIEQVKIWGFRVRGLVNGINARPTTETMPDIQILKDLRPDDPGLALARVRKLFISVRKTEQRVYVERVLRIIRSSDQWEP